MSECRLKNSGDLKKKNSSDIADNAKKLQLLYSTTVLFKVLDCKIKKVPLILCAFLNVFFFFFYL